GDDVNDLHRTWFNPPTFGFEAGASGNCDAVAASGREPDLPLSRSRLQGAPTRGRRQFSSASSPRRGSVRQKGCSSSGEPDQVPALTRRPRRARPPAPPPPPPAPPPPHPLPPPHIPPALYP